MRQSILTNAIGYKKLTVDQIIAECGVLWASDRLRADLEVELDKLADCGVLIRLTGPDGSRLFARSPRAAERDERASRNLANRMKRTYRGG